MLTLPIYMDNHATTRVDPRVVAAITPYFEETYGNAASPHVFGRAAKEAVESARATLAHAIGAMPKDLIFTSGATESNNLAIRGVAERYAGRGRHIVSVTTEHPAVLEPLEWLARRGFETTLLPVRPQGDAAAGCLDPQQVADALRDDTILVSVMAANNEIGAIAPLAEIGRICRARGVLLHTDATQAVGKMPFSVDALQVDLLSFTAHKIYGPKGVGALYVRRRTPTVRLDPLLLGGGHESGLRSGTLNVPGIVGFAAAVQLCLGAMDEEAARVREMRDRLWQRLSEEIDGVALNGPALEGALRLPGNLNVNFAGVDGEALVLNLPELAVSPGAACSSTSPEPSHVLRALGLADDAIRASVRFGLGRFNTMDEAEFAVDLVADAVRRLRAQAG